MAWPSTAVAAVKMIPPVVAASNILAHKSSSFT